MTTKQAVELVLVAFARMDKVSRRNLIEVMKKARVKLDFSYPNGMPEATPPDKPAQ